MRLPGLPSLLFLIYLLIVMPWLALRGARHLRLAGEGQAALPARETIWVNTLINQLLMLAFAWVIGGTFAYSLFAMPAFGAREVLAGGAALAISFALRALSRAIRTDEERRRMIVYALAPRTRSEWVLLTATVLAASVAEEAAYRGVAMAILWYSLGNGYIAAAICSLAFALAHSTQGGKSVLIIFGMAIVTHALVWVTGTLIVAMVVHAVYDFVAGYLISREARALDTNAAAGHS